MNTLEIKETSSGELYFQLSDDILERLGWREGDDIKFIEKDDGFMIKKVKYETVELDIDEEDLFKYMKQAHEEGMSFDEWVQHAIESMIDKIETSRDIAQSG
jgi:bifunctional DNA-binding transcriptional regulator/antitoxin component of YhaV-PrlF toxin-antitoxin module